MTDNKIPDQGPAAVLTAGPVLDDPRRLLAVRETGLLDTEVEAAFDRLTRFAVRLVGIPASFISLVDENRDFYKSSCGFGEPIASAREMHGQTFCHFTVQSTEPLVIPDTRADERYRDVPTVQSLGVAAYVGIPLVFAGQVIGAFCAIDTVPRNWTTHDVEALSDLATMAISEIELRAATRRSEESRRQLVAANAAKSEFLATMSHELRTPLNAILGYASLLELEISGAINAEQRVHLRRLHTSAEHLLALVNDVLDLSKLEAGEMLLASDVGSASAAVSSALALAASIAEARKIRLLPHASSTREVTYVGDEIRVRQILLNLASNAVKFTEPGGEVHVSTLHATGLPATVRLTGEGPWASIAVRDTGIGISPEHQASVFLPFKQIVGGHTRTSGGTGLGLAISRRLARLMGGDITLESVPGSGSTFTLWLPAAGVTNGLTETGEQRSVRARRHAPEHRVRGLTEIGAKLRDDVEQIMEAVITRIRADVAFRSTLSLSQADLEDHTLSFLANTVQSLIIVDQTGGIESPLMEDGMHIQQFMARSHGAQRARLGWTEAHVASEYAFVEEELAGRISLLGTEDPDDATLAIGILARLLVHARNAAIKGFRQWRASHIESEVVAAPMRSR